MLFQDVYVDKLLWVEAMLGVNGKMMMVRCNVWHKRSWCWCLMVSKNMFSVIRSLLSWGSYWGILHESCEPTCKKKSNVPQCITNFVLLTKIDFVFILNVNKNLYNLWEFFTCSNWLMSLVTCPTQLKEK